MHCLNSSQQSVRSGAAKAIAQFGCIELPVNEWPDLIETLLNNVSTGNPYNKQATLEALGIICEGIVLFFSFYYLLFLFISFNIKLLSAFINHFY